MHPIRAKLDAYKFLNEFQYHDHHIPADKLGEHYNFLPKHLKFEENGVKYASTAIGYNFEKAIAKEIARIGVENIHIVSGGPGSGKSTHLIAEWKKNPGKVMAPSGVAAQRLSVELCEASQSAFNSEHADSKPKTIHTTMQIPVDGDPKWLKSDGTVKGYARAKHYYMDEMSNVGPKLLWRFLQHVRKGAQIWLYGDPKQLPPVDTGSPFASMIGKVGEYIELKGNRRANNTELKSAIESIAAGEWPEDSHAFQTVETAGDSNTSCRRIAMQSYSQDAQILCPWKATALELGRNMAILRRRNGSTDLADLQPGDEVVSSMSMHRANVVNGCRYKLTRRNKLHYSFEVVDNPGEVIQIKTSEIKRMASMREIPADPNDAEVMSCFLFSGGLTVHKSQGSQYSSVAFVVHDTTNLSFFSRQMLYVAASRAKTNVTVYIVTHKKDDDTDKIKKALLTPIPPYVSRVAEFLDQM